LSCREGNMRQYKLFKRKGANTKHIIKILVKFREDSNGKGMQILS
jgi:hypothetical protein